VSPTSAPQKSSPSARTGCACKGERPCRTLKVNVCYATGWFAEAEISYAGPRAAERARLAGQTIQRQRLALRPCAPT
jgi:hypothetical protein